MCMAKHNEASRGNRWVRLKGSSTLAKFRLYNVIEIVSLSISIIVTQ
jgi:hypothetical protein